MCHIGHGGDVHHLEARIAEDLAEHQARLVPNRGSERLRVARIDEGGGDAEPGQGIGQEVVCPAV